MSAPAAGGCTPDGSVPTSAVTVPLGRDVGVQAAAGESVVLGTDQDISPLGAGDAASGQATQRGGIAMTPAATPQFTRGD